MPTFEQMFGRIRLDLELTAEDNGGHVPLLELRRIVCAKIGTDPRTFRNAKDALVIMGILKPINQYVYVYLDGHKTEAKATEEAVV